MTRLERIEDLLFPDLEPEANVVKFTDNVVPSPWALPADAPHAEPEPSGPQEIQVDLGGAPDMIVTVAFVPREHDAVTIHVTAIDCATRDVYEWTRDAECMSNAFDVVAEVFEEMGGAAFQEETRGLDNEVNGLLKAIADPEQHG